MDLGTPAHWDVTLRTRLAALRDDIVRPLRVLYGERDDFEEWVAHFLQISADAYANRTAPLRRLDEQRLLQPDWYQSQQQMGYICYVDRFADDLQGVKHKIPYLKEVGVTYLHLMPLLKPRAGENDGGYAVADYRQVDPRLGTMDDLSQLATRLRRQGISLCTDLVCNHTAIEHEWAQKALAGDEVYQDYYLMFPDRTLPDQYDETLREVFPEFKRGNFVHYPDIDRWVWTTFNLFQWDLNYANPAVFGEMLAIMLHLANQGVEVLRMDAVAFMWKELGTMCENLPQAHALLQAWRALTRLAAPSLILKAEAIVSPEDVVPYFGVGEGTGKECELAYHNSFMVYLWSALAERKVNLMTYALQQLPDLPHSATWTTYVRLHDDIGWAITDENAAGIGLNGFLHRSFLSDFYSGEYPNSFARGTVFQFNPDNEDKRINGSCASLAGLERALEDGDEAEIAFAIGRIHLIYSMILAYGGIPLLYMGDELGMLNDYGYKDVPVLAVDSRWVHRPKMNWAEAEERHRPKTLANRVFAPLQHMIAMRKMLPQLHAQAATEPVWLDNQHVFGMVRSSPRGRLLVLGNFTEYQQHVSASMLTQLGFGGDLFDYVSGGSVEVGHQLTMGPYQSMWLRVG